MKIVGMEEKESHNHSNKPVYVELGIEFLSELLLFLLPYGAEQMNLPHNFWLGLGCWIGGLAIAIRMFWIFPYWVPNRTKLERCLIALIFVGIFVAVVYRPVAAAYGKRNGESKTGTPSIVPQGQIGESRKSTTASQNEGREVMTKQGGHTASSKPSVATTTPGSITQSNSGGINVLQGTTGPNSPIINSPVTVNPGTPARTLGDKRTQFVAALKSFGPHDIAITPARGNKEAIDYAAEIESACKEAGWSVVPTEKLALLTKDGVGLSVVTKIIDRSPPTVIPWADLPEGQAALGQAFASIGIQIHAAPQANGETGPIELYVGLQ